ncbi:hypothetical protein BZA05DRAFT_421964 [Tricharina praecox]|uniref:uncharacterized protein n=1 Tax=Tricharina praecox TaxID=43433 RepID=UPI00221F48C6|nr:uncharacterized protein BZA05DRAFT_421964 [Tricharina praecox]KAI5844196.1 hypothetical protein BZA05DRAFT_421964 [Tricharina praecox]
MNRILVLHSANGRNERQPPTTGTGAVSCRTIAEVHSNIPVLYPRTEPPTAQRPSDDLQCPGAAHAPPHQTLGSSIGVPGTRQCRRKLFSASDPTATVTATCLSASPLQMEISVAVVVVRSEDAEDSNNDAAR